MTKIIIKKNLCRIDEEKSLDIIQALDNALSYKVPGAEHTRAFKGYYRNGQFIKWDGINRIFNMDLSFPVGLLARVFSVYAKFNILPTVENRNPPISLNQSIDILPKLESLGKSPYPYQTEVLDIIKVNNRGIIRAATGSGKTIVSALMVAYFGKPTILYVIGTDLLYQTHEFFQKVFNQEIGIVGDGKCVIKQFNIASVWTVGQALGMDNKAILLDDPDDEKAVSADKYSDIRNCLQQSKVHIFDECHLAACETIQEISTSIVPEHIYGMSASPYRDDGKDILIEACFGSRIVEIPASRLIQEGYLVKPYIKFVSVPKLTEKIEKKYPTVYKKYIIDNKVRNDLIAGFAKDLVDKGYQVLILYSRISHGKILYAQISNLMPCALLSGKDTAEVRKQAKDDLENKKINCIVASTIFDIGVDLPSLSSLIVAGGGKSSVRALQRIGRVIRKYPGKKRAAIVDFIDNAHFLKSHSEIRRQVYSMEGEFEIHWKE